MRSVVLMALAGVLASVAVPVAEAAAAGFERELLELHNEERARVGAPPLAWDAGLAADAETYARRLAKRGRGLVHSARGDRDGQGENLWMGSAGYYPLAAMFGSWAQEKRFFRAGVFPNVGRGVGWQEVGHYTQIVWGGTDRVGCGLHRSRGWDYLVCRYSPAGNMMGQAVP